MSAQLLIGAAAKQHERPNRKHRLRFRVIDFGKAQPHRQQTDDQRLGQPFPQAATDDRRQQGQQIHLLGLHHLKRRFDRPRFEAQIGIQKQQKLRFDLLGGLSASPIFADPNFSLGSRFASQNLEPWIGQFLLKCLDDRQGIVDRLVIHNPNLDLGRVSRI